MPSLNDVLADRKEIEVKINGFPIALAYRPSTITMAENALVARMAEEGDQLAVAKRFCRQVASTDLTGPLTGVIVIEPDEDDDDGEVRFEERELVAKGDPIPLDPEIVQHVGQEVLLAIMRAIQEDTAKDPTSRRKTRTGSRRRG